MGLYCGTNWKLSLGLECEALQRCAKRCQVPPKQGGSREAFEAEDAGVRGLYGKDTPHCCVGTLQEGSTETCWECIGSA